MKPTDTEADLIVLAQHGDRQAQAQMVSRYEHIPRTMMQRWRTVTVMSFDDLMQEGRMGILEAVRTFDVSKDASFNTYCNMVVRRYLVDYSREFSRVIKIPVQAIRQYSAIVSRQIEHRNKGSNPSLKDVAVELGINPELVPVLVAFIEENAGDGGTPIENLSDEEHPGSDEDVHALVAEALEIRRMGSALMVALNTLTENEQTVVKLYYGMTEHPPLSQTDIAALLGVSRSRVSQLHTTAKKKLNQRAGILLRTKDDA